ncbi:MAG: internal scaffolding protein [Microviridae sp.]|nr:MAG: internal scaffolding protein [Microviridae sp.]
MSYANKQLKKGERPKDGTDFKNDKGLAVQHLKDEVDINKIVARIQKTGLFPERRGEPFFGDVSDLGGLADAYRKVQESKELFMEFPADIREKFQNDPIKMISFLEDENNFDKAVEIGLVQKPIPEVPEPQTPPQA